MEKKEFQNACYEVLEILKFITEEDIKKIPLEEIKILKDNANYEHDFKYNVQKNIKEQDVSKLAKGIIAIYFSKYIATKEQQEKIRQKREYDLKTIEKEKIEKYDSEKIFESKTNNEEYKHIKKNNEIVEYKEKKWYKKIILFLKRLLKM